MVKFSNFIRKFIVELIFNDLRVQLISKLVSRPTKSKFFYNI